MNEYDKKSLRWRAITEVIGLQDAVRKICLRSFRCCIRGRGQTMSFSLLQPFEVIWFLGEVTVHQARSKWRGYVY